MKLRILHILNKIMPQYLGSLKLFPLGILLMFQYICHAQNEINFGQYMLFQPIVNIASAGSYAEPSMAAYGRKQWASINGAPTNFGLQYLHTFDKNAIGISLNHDAIGVHSRQKILPYYSHKINITLKEQLTFGLGLGAEIIESQFSKVSTGDSYDGAFLQDQSALGAIVSFGTYFFSEKYYLGFSIPSITHNKTSKTNSSGSFNTSFNTEYWHYYFLGGYEFKVNHIININTSSLVKLAAYNKTEFDINTQINLLQQLGIGLSYRSDREILFLANYTFNQKLKVGYCYHSYFGINSHLLSGQELIIVVRLSKQKKASIQSPRF